MLGLFLSTVFLSAAISKLHDPWQLALTTRELLPHSPRYLAHSLAFLVIGLELLVAATFTAGPRPLGLAGAAGSCLLAAAFAGAYLLSRRLPYPVRCGCLGSFRVSVLSWHTLVTSAVLLATALAWTWAAGPLATFTAYPIRLLALAPAAVIVIARRTQSARPRLRPGPGSSWRADQPGGGERSLGEVP